MTLDIHIFWIAWCPAGQISYNLKEREKQLID